MYIESKNIYLIILLILGIYLLYSSPEKNTCIDDIYIETLLNRIKLDKKIYNIVFNSSKSSYYKDNSKLGTLLSKKKPEEKIKIINQIQVLMNNNRHHDIYNDYSIDENTPINSIRNAWIQDNILNKLVCSVDRKQIEILNNYIISLLTASHLKMCSKDALIKHCHLTYDNKVKQINSEVSEEDEEETTPVKEEESVIKKIINDNKETDKVIEKMTNFIYSKGSNNLIEGLANITKVKFETNSLENVLRNVNTSSFGDLEKPYLIKFINLFEKNIANHLILKTNDIVKLVIMVVPEAIKLAKQIKSVSRSDPKKPGLVRQFIPLKVYFISKTFL